jgi:hypothetical protein
MALYVVSYDLVKKSESEYQDLWDELDTLDSVKTQDSVYYVSSSKTQWELLELLEQHIHENDRMMVATFTRKPNYTKALKGTNAWLDRHFSS